MNIYEIRGQKVMLDNELAELYGIETRSLNQAVVRNHDRFPKDFMFDLSEEEETSLKSQIVTSNLVILTEKRSLKSQFVISNRGGRRKRSKVFTEHGILMLSSVLKSERAVSVNIQIMRMFVEMRKAMINFEQLRYRLDKMEQDYDQQFKVVFEAIQKILDYEQQAEQKSEKALGFDLTKVKI